MKAVEFSQYGSTDFLKYGELKKPVPKEDEVLIKVHAASVNSWDWELMKGTPFANRLTFGIMKPKKINVLGVDVAGVVESIGKNVTKFEVGDKVFGDLSHGHWGAFAEYTCAKEMELDFMPEGLSFAQASTIPQAGLLALQGLQDKIKHASGQKVLINGGGGGVGTFAIQMAKLFGCEVTGVDHTDKLDLMGSLGADHVIDYTQEDFTKSGKLYDLILDVSLHHSISECKRVLSSEGSYIVVGGENSHIMEFMLLGPFVPLMGGKTMGVLFHKANKGLNQIKALVEEGKIKPVIDRCYPLEKVDEAIRYIQEGKAKGKVVISVIND